MENNVEKGCGTCAMFVYEDTYGNGFCEFYQDDTCCEGCCDDWIEMSEDTSETE
jgi:hypothetical protein